MRDCTVNPLLVCYNCRKVEHQSKKCKEKVQFTDEKEACIYADILNPSREKGLIQETAKKDDILSVDIVSGEGNLDTFEYESEMDAASHVDAFRELR